jgi:hypothetical protein
MIFNLPTALTWLRIVLIPVFVGVYYLPDSLLSLSAKNWLAMSIFALAAITDWADGYLARRWGQTSAFGAFLDPVADKLIVAAALIVLVWLRRADAWLVIIIIGREIAVPARARMDGADRQVQKRRRSLHRQGQDGGADHGHRRTAAVSAAHSRHRHDLARRVRALGGGDPDAVVDVALFAARGAASVALGADPIEPQHDEPTRARPARGARVVITRSMGAYNPRGSRLHPGTAI